MTVSRYLPTTKLGKLRLMGGYGSQREFARKIKMTAPAWHRVERGIAEPTMATVTRASRAMGVSVEVFMAAWNEAKKQNERGER